MPDAPAFPLEKLNQAVARQTAGDLAGAQSIYWHILVDDPAQFDALHLLGVSLCQQGRQEQGAWFIGRALERRPDDATALYNRGMALAQLHRHEQALASFDRALARNPAAAQAWSSRGDALQNLARNAEAVDSYRRALAHQPGMPGTISNLGTALLALGQAEQAVQLFQQALSGGADRSAVHANIARALQDLGDRDGTARHWAEACAADPDAAEPRWQQATSLLPDIPIDPGQVAASRISFATALDRLGAWYDADPSGRRDEQKLAMPFFLAYQDHDNRALMERFGALRARLMDRWRHRTGLAATAPRPRGAGPLVVGVVSPHLYSHSVWHAITRGWFAHLDPARVALHGFHTGPKSDAETEFARARAAGFTHGDRPLADWVRAIQASRPDVLLYPALGMDVVSANLAALRLAPYQLASWGHPETTGFPTIDAYLSAEAFEPPGADSAYSETLIRLPGLGASFRPQTAPPAPPDFAALGLDPARPILVCPGTPFKYAPEHDAVLVGLVRAIPGAQLVFFGTKTNSPLSARLQRRLAARFAAAGLDHAAHCRLLPFQPIAAFYGLLRRADLCLDTIGFSGFNTALQAVGNLVPLVAYEARFMRGRLASGLLRTMGLDELVATDPASFVAIAARLVDDRIYRAAVQARIATAVPPLYDDRRPADALMAVLEKRIDR